MARKNKKKLKIICKTFQVDAKGQVLGRLASRVAFILRGKNQTNYISNKLPNNIVVVNNIEKLLISGKKLKQKQYFHFTGYPGGIKTESMGELWQKNPAQLFRKVIYHMLPANKSRRRIMKNLKFEN